MSKKIVNTALLILAAWTLLMLVGSVASASFLISKWNAECRGIIAFAMVLSVIGVVGILDEKKYFKP